VLANLAALLQELPQEPPPPAHHLGRWGRMCGQQRMLHGCACSWICSLGGKC
jgi:hypothetical protein